MEIKAIIYIVVALFVLGAGAAVVGKYNHAITAEIAAKQEAEEAVHSAQAWEDKAGNLQGLLDESESISKARGKRLDAANARLAETDAAYQRLRLSQPDSARWLDGAVPDDVRRLRRTAAGCPTADLNLPCPGDVTATDKGTADAGRDKRAAEQVGTGGARSPANVQR